MKPLVYLLQPTAGSSGVVFVVLGSAALVYSNLLYVTLLIKGAFNVVVSFDRNNPPQSKVSRCFQLSCRL